MRSLRRGGLVGSLVLALAAGVAYADQTIYAGPPNQFVGGDVKMDQGEKVTFTNVDTQVHDVTAEAKGADGKPLFASEKAGTGQSKPVVGTEYLRTGTYNYVCSIHSFMKGTITVSANGTPAPRPGGGGGSGGGGGGGYGGPPSSGSSTDTTAPRLSLKVLDTKRSAVRKRRSLQVAVTTDEASTVGVTAKSGKTTVASGTSTISKAGTKKVSLKLTKAGLKMAKRSRALRVTVSGHAADAAGNSSTATAWGRLR